MGRCFVYVVTLCLVAGLGGCAMTGDWQPSGVVYEVRGDVKAPAPIDLGELTLPEDLHRLWPGGCAEVSMIVDEDGVPRQVRAVRPPTPELERWAVGNAEQTLFQPATKGGVPVAVRTSMSTCIDGG